jgi:Zn-dependent protease
MRCSWRIGTIAGIGVSMHAAFLLLILFILGLYLHQGCPLEGALAGTLFILVIFGCIVLRELGHLAQFYFGARAA